MENDAFKKYQIHAKSGRVFMNRYFLAPGLLFILVIVLSACQGVNARNKAAAEHSLSCPMHPQITSENPVHVRSAEWIL